jgi:two-component system KDP operon response regulator KdpE
MTKHGKANILVVDDDARYLRLIQINLEASGYGVIPARSGEEALKIAAQAPVDLILLDIMMPNTSIDGYEACRLIRQFSDVPILILTALSETHDIVRGLDLGADDYITKPFDAPELLARVRAALRRGDRAPSPEPHPVFRSGDLTVNFARQRVYRDDEEVHLTPTEYRLLKELVRNEGRVLVPEHLLERVWGIGHAGETHLLWQAIHRLRQKIEPDPQDPHYIVTRPGIGYLFANDV